MKPSLFAALTAAALMGMNAYAADAPKPEWKVRPPEIINGLKPHSDELWSVDKNSIDGWKASNKAVLSTTDETKLWGEKVAKVAFPNAGSVTVSPAEPIVIETPCDGIDLWFYGPANNGVGSQPTVSFLIVDADGKTYRVNAEGMGSRWAKQRWWGMSAAIFPKETKFPVKVKSFTVKGLLTATKDDFFCFDRLGAFHFKHTKIADVEELNLPIPTTPDGVMPASMEKDGKNSVEKLTKGAVFSYTSGTTKLAYAYQPESGTLSDVTVTLNGGAPFKVAKAGGVRGKVDGVEFFPGAPDMTAKLVKSSFKNGKLFTSWQWTRSGKSLAFDLNFSIKGKSLAVEASSKQLAVTGFDAGFVEGLTKPQLFGETYLNNRWDYPRMLAAREAIVSVFADWYYSNATEIVESSGRYEFGRAEVLSDTSARMMGGVGYGNKSDGTLNPLYERFYYTVSTELEDVLPTIANPVSPYREEMSKTICNPRAYAMQGYANDGDCEIAFWKKMKDYGAGDVFVRYHSGQFRSPIESNHFNLELNGALSNGGDAPLKKMLAGVRESVKYVGPYDDNRVISPLSPYFDYDLISHYTGGKFLGGWDGCFRPKAMAMLEIYKDFAPKFKAKYPEYNALYLDELSNVAPWADVDFDASAPGAGTFRAVFKAFAAHALELKKIVNGPLWSEGCSAYFWTGLLDADYGVSNDYNAKLPLMVDFKLRKLNPLAPLHGADWPILSSNNEDLVIASEIASGNIGTLAYKRGEHGTLPNQGRMFYFETKDFDHVLKSYFMLRQLQEYFYNSPVKSIRYFVDGKLMTPSEMLRAGKQSQDKIAIEYESGLEVYVNRALEGEWTVNVDGEDYTLAPNCHVAFLMDELLQYSVMQGGRRVDYSRGPLYTYVNAHGQAFEFPEMTASGAYLMKTGDSGATITPVPFLKAETVKGLAFDKATPLDQDGKAIGAERQLDKTDAGRADLPVDGKAFKYQMK